MVHSYVADAYAYTDGAPALVGDIVAKTRGGAEWKVLAISTFSHSGAERVALESHTGRRLQRTGAGLHELRLVRRADDAPTYVDGTLALVGDTVMKASGGGHWEITRFVTLEDTGRPGAAIVSRDGQKTPHGNLSTTHTIDLAGLHFVARKAVALADPVDDDVVELAVTPRRVTAEDLASLSAALSPAEMDRYPGKPMHEVFTEVRLDDLDGIVRREVDRALDEVYTLVAPGFLTDRGRAQLRECLDSVRGQRGTGASSHPAAWLVEAPAEDVSRG